ncbi:hypothetical protein ABZ619_39140 [Streptomyces sp. NPDC007851]|uniref:hypothetical protein n=1 Tax=Streptomyces sp. NPDC007851 TaxID=3155008 RepID=UPI003405AE07
MAEESTGGRCDTGRPLCGKPARPYAAGWRCDEHRPHSLHRVTQEPRPAAG